MQDFSFLIAKTKKVYCHIHLKHLSTFFLFVQIRQLYGIHIDYFFGFIYNRKERIQPRRMNRTDDTVPGRNTLFRVVGAFEDPTAEADPPMQ